MKVEFVAQELTKRFTNNDFNEITVTMKCNGEQVAIEPCFYVEKANSMKDICYFLIHCSIRSLGGCKTVEDLAKCLINFESYIEEDKNGRDSLNEYFNQYIIGHTRDELTLGNDICRACYDLYDKLPKEKRVGYVFDTSYDGYYLNEYHKSHPEYTMDELNKAYSFSNHFDYYSDRYKELYGYRPRIF